MRVGRQNGLAAIGDSITAGNGRPGSWFLPRDSWVTHLIKAGLPFTCNGAVPNQTTADIAAQLPDVLARKPRVVTILAGINDILKSTEPSVEGVARMVANAEAAGASVAVGTLPPWESDVDRVIRFNAHLRTLGVPVLDFFAALSAHGRWRAGYSVDGLHPTELGARAMAAAALPELRRLLAAPPPHSSRLSRQ